VAQLSQQIAGFILAGGESSRMGHDKALLELNGAALVVRTARLVEAVTGTPAIVGAPERLGGLGFTVIPDDWPGAGPLGGIATALHITSASWNLIVACDLPYLTRAWLENLVAMALASAADAVLPMNERGAEPLCAMYQKKCQPVIRAALERGTRKVTDGLVGLRLKSITPAEWKAFDSDGLLFKNMNSPADYEEAKARVGGRPGR
jgi:molybdopterin-guanine dinucleotide biosynthesis protein A